MNVLQVETHVISSIVHIAHKYDNDSVPWPLQIEDHFGKMHNVVLKAGEVNKDFNFCFCSYFYFYFFILFSLDIWLEVGYSSFIIFISKEFLILGRNSHSVVLHSIILYHIILYYTISYYTFYIIICLLLAITKFK